MKSASHAHDGAFIPVYVRWRPAVGSEVGLNELNRSTTPDRNTQLSSVSVSRHASAARPEWTSTHSFQGVLGPEDDNAQVFSTVVEPVLPKILQGGNCNFFVYGHTGSGKTHTTLGYDGHETSGNTGLCLMAAQRLFDALDIINKDDGEERLGIGISLFELRRKTAYDLLNGHTACHVREGYDGKTHIRGETEVLEGGKVRVRPIVKRPCWTFDSFRQELQEGISSRSVGTSSVHNQSSRTHAILELEIISQSLVDARTALIDRQSELVPVAKHATDVSIEEQTASIVRTPDGKWIPNPDRSINQQRIDEAEMEKARFEARVQAAEENVNTILESRTIRGLGGKMVFVDLAGAEYHQEKGRQAEPTRQTPQELQEGREINTDLLALKEVIRALRQKQPRIPFRSSTLTMVLREHFTGSPNSFSAMIVTLSPAEEKYAATLDSLKYGALVGGVRKTRKTIN